MISIEHVRAMARYNEWQNRSLYAAAETISDAERRKQRGAFFGSIHGTLSHLMWGDQQWMSRFAPDVVQKPSASGKESPDAFPDWEDLKRQRIAMDGTIIAWADRLDASSVYGDLYWYSGLAKANVSKPRWFIITHFFNHQTHHRGQVHAMLTQAGAKPEPTDLGFM